MRYALPFYVSALLLISISANAGIRLDYICTVKSETVAYGLPNDSAKGSTRFMHIDENYLFKSYVTVEGTRIPVAHWNKDGSVEALQPAVTCGMLAEVYGCRETSPSTIEVSSDLIKNGRGAVRTMLSPFENFFNVADLECRKIDRN